MSHNSIKEKLSHHNVLQIHKGLCLTEKFSCRLYVPVCLRVMASEREHLFPETRQSNADLWFSIRNFDASFDKHDD